MRLMNRNHMLWGSTARLSYVCGAKSRDMGCSYARGTTRRRDMRDVVSPYVIGTILTVGNTGGADTDPKVYRDTPVVPPGFEIGFWSKTHMRDGLCPEERCCAGTSMRIMSHGARSGTPWISTCERDRVFRI